MMPLPYTSVNLKEWSVTALFAQNDLESFQGEPLNDIADFNPDNIEKNQIEQDSMYQYIDLGCVSPESGLLTQSKEIKGEELPSRAKLIVKEGDILLSAVRPERNIVCIATKEYNGCIVNTSFVVIRPKECKSETLYFFLRSPKINELISSKAKGTAIPTLKLNDLKELKIPFKNFTQDANNKAVNLFCKWVQHSKSLKTVPEIVEEQFIKYNIVSKNSSAKGKTSNMDVIPYNNLKDRLDVAYYMDEPYQDWLVPVNSLSNITKEFRSGKAISSKEYKDEGVPYIRIKDMQEGHISKNNLVYVNKQFSDDNQKTILSSGDVLISRVGTIGKSALVSEDMEGALANQHITIVKTDENIMPDFLAYCLNTHWVAEQFERNAAGSAQRFIKLIAIKDVQIPVPSMELQEKITAKVEEEIEKTSISTVVLKQEIATITNELLQ